MQRLPLLPWPPKLWRPPWPQSCRRRPLLLWQLAHPMRQKRQPRLVPRVHAQLDLVLAIIHSALPHLDRATTPTALGAWLVPVAYPARHAPRQVPWAASPVRRVPIRARCARLCARRLELVPVVPAHVQVAPVVRARVLVAVPVVPAVLVVPVAQGVLAVPVAQVVPVVASAAAQAVLVVALPEAALPEAVLVADAQVPVVVAAQQEHSVARVASRRVVASPSVLSVKSSTICAHQKLVAYASLVVWAK